MTIYRIQTVKFNSDDCEVIIRERFQDFLEEHDQKILDAGGEDYLQETDTATRVSEINVYTRESLMEEIMQKSSTMKWFGESK